MAQPLTDCAAIVLGPVADKARHRDRQHILLFRPKQISNQILNQKKQSPQASLLYGGRSSVGFAFSVVGHFQMITLGQF